MKVTSRACPQVPWAIIILLSIFFLIVLAAVNLFGSIGMLFCRSNTTVCELITTADVPDKSQDPYQAINWFDKFLETYDTNGHGIHRWINYFYPYQRHFERFRGKSIVLIEIGVQSGGSINMWQAFFGTKLQYIGIDIDSRTKMFARENVSIFVCDQGDEKELRKIAADLPNPDIVIDDGGHTMKQQKITFQVLFPLLKIGGVYLIEDLHTSYWNDYGGSSELNATLNNFTLIETSKMWVDIVNLQHIQNERFTKNEEWKSLHQNIGGISFYDSMVFVDKTKVRYNVAKHWGGKWI